MKNVVLGIVAGCMMILSLTLVLTLYGRNVRRTELEESLRVAMEQTMKQDQNEIFTRDQEMVSDFMQNLLIQMNSISDLQIKILCADARKGFLSVEVTQSYQHPFQKKGEISVRRSILIDEKKQEKKPSVYRFRFYIRDEMGKEELYKEYQLQEGEALWEPIAPTRKGKRFCGWSDETGKSVDLTNKQAAYSQDLYAVFQ